MVDRVHPLNINEPDGEESMQTRTERPIVDWFEESYVLRDADGDKIGDIIEINPDFIVADSDGGFLGLGAHRRYFVPRSAVTGQDGDGWFLWIDKDQIEGMSWTAAPTGSAFATEGWRQQYGYDDDDIEGGAPWYLGEVQTGVAGTDAAPAEPSAGMVPGGQEVPGRMRMIRF